MKPTPLAAAAAFVLIAGSGVAGAQTVISPTVKLSGYGTIAAGILDDGNLQLRNDVTVSKGTSNKIDIGNDSRFGLQANVDFGHDLTVVGQLVAKRRVSSTTPGSDKDFDPQVEWLYAQYEFLPGANVRLGRMALPTFLLSDSLNVSYAVPWLRAPSHMYGSQALKNVDGAQLNWRTAVGGLNLTAQASYGQGRSTIYLPTIVDPTSVTQSSSDRLWGLNVVAEYGDWLARIGTARSSSPLTFPFGNVNLQDNYDSVGLQYDNGQALVMAEFAKRSQNDVVPTSGGNKALAAGNYAYVAAGWRFGKLTPLVYVSHVDSKQPALNAERKFNAFGASLRYDVVRNAAVKVQFDQHEADDEIVFTQPRVGDRSKVHSLLVGLDFVF